MKTPDKVDKILECYRALKEEGAMGGGSFAPQSAVPPIMLLVVRSQVFLQIHLQWISASAKPRKLNMFYRQAVKQSRKGAKNGRKGN